MLVCRECKEPVEVRWCSLTEDWVATEHGGIDTDGSIGECAGSGERAADPPAKKES